VIATKTRRKPSRKATKPARRVTETLLELTYFLHATRVISRPAKNR